MLKAFRAATDAGDMAGLVELLHPAAVYVADGGGEVTAARRPVRGAETSPCWRSGRSRSGVPTRSRSSR
ncbi:hypothetical protein [Nonomuraea sp. NPDC050691]|uniref:hypothetical protein n=1 Tax=Nonomuraea sp. NPDC050691 TaxID=3155661 RepID=UPI0033F90DD7